MASSHYILIVDEEPDVPRLFRQRFRKEIRAEKLALQFVCSGEEALLHLADRLPDLVLVLSDIRLPGIRGLDLLKEIKAQHTALPVVITMDHEDKQSRQWALHYGATACLTKPLDLMELKKKIFECHLEPRE